MINGIIFSILVGAFSLPLAQGDATQGSNGRLLEAAPTTVHVVYLRTGAIDADEAQKRLPPPTPTARRLLQQLRATPPAQSPEWGPLARCQLWVLTLGPTLHWQEGGQHLVAQPGGGAAAASQKQQQHRHSIRRPGFGEAQALLRARLHQAGAALVSFLPPAAWLLTVADDADLAPVLEAFPDVRLAPYGPPNMRVSPELAAAVGLVRRAGEAVAERIAAGERLDQLMEEAAADKSGWLLGAMRPLLPTQGSAASVKEAADGDKSGASSDPFGGSSGGGPRSPRRRVQVEVHFPHLELADLAVLAAVNQGQSQKGGDGQGDGDGGSSSRAGRGSRRRQRRSGDTVYHPAAAAAADWLAPLTALSPSDCPPLLEPDFSAPELLLVGVCPEALTATVEWLAEAPQVSWLSPRMSVRLHNLASSAILQTGGNWQAARNNASSLYSHPFWAAGLDGRNQTVGCGDSGLDYANCYFYDGTVDPSKTGIDGNGMQYFSSESHRKLRYYLALVQDMSDSFGHGTHVAGTLVGSRYNKSSVTDEPLALGTGQAPAAKIAFLDLSRGNSDGVWTPGDLYRSYFNLTYRVGARVHSDSWGSELTAYDSMSASLDRFTFANQDFVSVFAAGNYGDRSSRSSRGTVTSPAVAKNCIAVGATLSINTGGFGRQPPAPMTSMTVYLDLPGGRFTRSVRVVKAGFGGSFDSLGSAVTPLVVANPENACTGLANAGAVSGKVVLVQRGGCYFTEKARSAAAAGARAVIVYNDAKDSGYFAMSPPSDVPANSISLPLGSVPLSAGTWLKASVEAGTVSVFFSGVDQSTNYPPYEDIAPYSSVGPTTDGRIKPDIVAPGTLLSANSSRTTPVPGRPGTCDRDTALVSMSGTSMATPVVAGSALLARQYFTDGYYPSGVRNPSAGFVPSGPLIKAVLLGGAQHMTGVVSDTGMPLEDAPSFRQGFGRLSLLHALPLATSSPLSPGWRLQVVDGAALSEGQHHQYCVTSLGGPLRITLAWYDYPGEQAAARALVNNLDLQVRAAGRGLLLDYGNGAQDVVNTVEKVWYDNLEPGDVAIMVVAESIFQKAMKQPYALVVQGNFTGSLPLRGSADPSAASNMCAAQLAVIDSAMSPPPIYNSNNLTFYFGTQDGSTPSGGFECRLVLEADSSSGGWEGCSAPLRNYLRVGDGRYSFQVRVKDSQVAATRSVLVDTIKPVITLASSLPDGADSQGTATDNVTFSFSATDASSAVTFRCSVEFQNGPQGRTTPVFLRFGPGTAAAAANDSSSGGAVAGGGGSGNRTVPVRQTFSCGSPLELNGMTYGDYALLVSALDAAGNRADANRVNWKIRYSPTTLYARITTGPTGLVATRELRYGVIGFLGSAAATTPPDQLGLASGQQAYEFAAAPLPAAGSDGGGSLQNAAARAGWTQMTNTSVTAAAPSDGSYLVLVRPRQLNTDLITWGVASVQVDTTPPTVNITRGPQQYQSDPRVTIMYGDDSSSDDVRAFFCRTLNTTSPPPPDPDTPESVSPYSPCSREGATFNTSEGYWLFQVKGRDAAGNVGPPAHVSFITDLQPPAITTTLPSVVNVSRLEWSYNLTDTGTGVNNNSCSFRWVALDNATVIDDGSEEFPPADNNPTWKTPCPQPPFRYTLQEGLYMFSVAATDRAGLRSSLDRQVVADFSKPTSRASIGNRRAVPARFTVFVTSRDLPKTVYSGLVRHECKVEAAAAPPPVSPPPPPPSPPPAPASSPPPPFALPPGSRVAAVPSPVAVGGNGGDGGSRRMTQQQQGDDGSPRLLNGSAIQMGAWHVCDPTGSATNVTYDGFSTGYYTFSVRALDAAGNMGNATEPLFFTVDATLPTDGSETTQVGGGGGGGGASDRTKKIVIGVAVLVGVIVLLATGVAIFVARRRYLRKRYAGSSSAAAAPGLAAPPLPPLQPQRSNGGGVIALQPIPSSYVNGSYANGNGHGYSNGGVNGHAAVGGPTLATVPSVGLPTPPVGSYYYPPVGGGGVMLATPVADPALAAALSASAAEAARARSAAEAATAAAEEERLRRALELSIEEENLRRAKEASLAAAQHHTAEQSALEAAIAASLATADQERQRQQQRAAAVQRQVQQQQLHAPPSAPPATSPRAPDYDLI